MSLQDSPGETGAPTTWEEYAKLAADAMGRLARSEITLSRCYALLPPNPCFVSKNVHHFIRNVVSEVDNDQSGFRELRDLLKNGATQSQIVDFMNWLG